MKKNQHNRDCFRFKAEGETTSCDKEPSHVGACHKHQMLKKKKRKYMPGIVRAVYHECEFHMGSESRFLIHTKRYRARVHTCLSMWRFFPDTRNSNHCCCSINSSKLLNSNACRFCLLACVCFVNEWIGMVSVWVCVCALVVQINQRQADAHTNYIL